MGFNITKPVERRTKRLDDLQRAVRECIKCGGRGTVPVPDTENTVSMCECRLAWTVTRALEPFGDVERRPHGWRSPLGDHIEDSLYIVGPWSAVAPHTRDAVGRRVLRGVRCGKDYAFRIVSDHDLLHASFARAGRGGTLDDAPPETHRDLVDPLWDLVIVRLGFLATRNANAPGVLREALRHRIEQSRKPTWIINEGSWGPGAPSWDQGVQEYVESSMSRVDITEDDEP